MKSPGQRVYWSETLSIYNDWILTANVLSFFLLSALLISQL